MKHSCLLKICLLLPLLLSLQPDTADAQAAPGGVLDEPSDAAVAKAAKKYHGMFLSDEGERALASTELRLQTMRNNIERFLAAHPDKAAVLQTVQAKIQAYEQSKAETFGQIQNDLMQLETLTQQLREDKATKADLQQTQANVEALLKFKTLADKHITDAQAELKKAQGDIATLTTRTGVLEGDVPKLDARIKGLTEKYGGLIETAERLKNADELQQIQTHNTRNLVSRLWILVAAAMVFFMQAGFKALEVGMVRKCSSEIVGFKNLLDWLIASVAFYFCGFHIMFAISDPIFFGWGDLTWFLPTPESLGNDALPLKTDIYPAEEAEGMLTVKGAEKVKGIYSGLGFEFFLFQLAFAGTAATIVSGALAGRVSKPIYAVLSILVSGLLYPWFGRIAWGDSYYGGAGFQHDIISLGLVAAPGEKVVFHDFAGGCVVHLMGASVALAAMIVLGPRRRHQQLTEKIHAGNISKFGPANLAYSALGCFILWFGWWGFNGGSNLRFDFTVGEIILNTNTAAAVGGLSAMLLEVLVSAVRTWHQRKMLRIHDYNHPEITPDKLPVRPPTLFAKTMGGVLGGLVAVTPGADVLSFGQSILVGVVAGFLHNAAYWLFCEFSDETNTREDSGPFYWVHKMRNRLDDPVGAVPVHGVCAIWGVFFVAFAHSKIGETYTVLRQLHGIGVAFLIGFGATLLVMLALRWISGSALRDDPVEHIYPDEGAEIEAFRLKTGEALLDEVFSFKTGLLGWSEPMSLDAFRERRLLLNGLLSQTNNSAFKASVHRLTRTIKGLKWQNMELSEHDVHAVIIKASQGVAARAAAAAAPAHAAV